MRNGLRTTLYIDGFNFYYGQVKGTPYKWLNPESLFSTVLSSRNNITRIKYFTARVQPNPNDQGVEHRQNTYLRALNSYCTKTEIYYGHFLRHRIFMPNASPPPNTVRVWKTEEKGSDVNLALHILNDAWLDNYDCTVVVSNDSDLAESLRMVKQQHKKIIGIITPGGPRRRTSRQLLAHADFVRPIRKWMLRTSLLPDLIPNSNIRKPDNW